MVDQLLHVGGFVGEDLLEGEGLGGLEDGGEGGAGGGWGRGGHWGWEIFYLGLV